MALTKCKECGKEVSSRAETCPQCGIKNPGQRWWYGVLGLFILVLILFAIFSNSEHKTDKQKAKNTNQSTVANQKTIENNNQIKTNPEMIVKKAIASIAIPPSWENIEASRLSDTSYSIFLYYKYLPSGYDEVETDLKNIARAILNQLVIDGRDPSKEWISVNVHAFKSEKGETGKDLVRDLGEVHYDFNNDQLLFSKD